MLTEMANLLNRLCLSFCPSVPFAAHHELPGDAGDLIGERYSHQLWFLALQEFKQPLGGMSASTCPDILKKGGCSNHQYAPEHFVASSGDHPEPTGSGGARGCTLRTLVHLDSMSITADANTLVKIPCQPIHVICDLRQNLS